MELMDGWIGTSYYLPEGYDRYLERSVVERYLLAVRLSRYLEDTNSLTDKASRKDGW